MYNIEHPAYLKLGQIGKEITAKVKPLAVVVFSAHWQASRDTIQVNTADITDLIYEYIFLLLTNTPRFGFRSFGMGELMLMRLVCSFYGFPSHYYKEKYPNVGSREVAGRVLESLAQHGIKGQGVKRGLDHGVWASFKCGMPYSIPTVYLSTR